MMKSLYICGWKGDKKGKRPSLKHIPLYIHAFTYNTEYFVFVFTYNGMMLCKYTSSANTKHLYDICTTPAQCLRRPTMYTCYTNVLCLLGGGGPYYFFK